MPIDPRIALGVEPFKTPDFLNFAAQTANIRQSQAAEQNALALMAQRQRQEQEAMNVTNALRGFDPSDPAAINRLYQMPGGAPVVRDVFEAQRAQTLAGGATREAAIAKRDQALKDLLMPTTLDEVISSVYDSMTQGGLTKQQADSVIMSLPKTDAELPAWQRQRAVQLLTPEQRAQTTRVTRDRGGIIEEEVLPTYGQQTGTRTFTTTMTPYQNAQLAMQQQQFNLQQQRENRLAQEAQQKEDYRGYSGAQAESARGVVDKVDRLIGNASNPQGGILQSGEAGALGAAARNIPGTTAYDVGKTIDSIKANIGFDRLQRMRNESITGGALGSVAVREIDFLQSTIESLDQGQSLETLRSNLAAVRASYQRLINAMEGIRAEKAAAAAAAAGGGGSTKAPPGVDPAVWNVMTPEEKALWK